MQHGLPFTHERCGKPTGQVALQLLIHSTLPKPLQKQLPDPPLEEDDELDSPPEEDDELDSPPLEEDEEADSEIHLKVSSSS